MKKMNLSNDYLSAFCLQVSLLLHAGISIGDGLQMLAEDEEDAQAKKLLLGMSEQVDNGLQMSDAMEQSGCFPDYVVYMARTGEETGRTEAAFKALADYYERQRQLSERIRSAILYPVILLILMLLIIGILLVRVLPIFDTVYRQLGGSMTGMAAGLLRFGEVLSSALPVLGIVMGIFAVAVLVLYFSDGLRAKLTGWLKSCFGDRGVFRKVGMARFASALSMGMMSGLAIEDAMRTAMDFHEDSRKVRAGYEQCLENLEQGEPLADSLKKADIFPAMYCRMISLGVKSGAGDDIMVEIAGRLEEDAERTIDGAVSRIEPTIVIITSILVGVILLSVMIPLMNIMASIG
ncbi:MAG: type II secretion system F family protein [Lachnospiraceae bacterium]|nr:type II secretion system F family protein [Lachnospiraceae bacterium]